MGGQLVYVEQNVDGSCSTTLVDAQALELEMPRQSKNFKRGVGRVVASPLLVPGAAIKQGLTDVGKSLHRAGGAINPLARNSSGKRGLILKHRAKKLLGSLGYAAKVSSGLSELHGAGKSIQKTSQRFGHKGFGLSLSNDNVLIQDAISRNK